MSFHIRNFFKPSIFAKTGSIIEHISFKKLLVANIIFFMPVVFVFPIFGILFGFFFATVVVSLIGKMSQRKLGGITGDTLRATAFLTELAFLFGLTTYLSGSV